MANGKDPAFPLYAADFLTDSRLWSIGPAEGFALVRLWAFLWKEGPRTIAQIRSAAPMLRCDPSTAEALAREWLEEQQDGRWSSSRLEAERAERAELRAKRAEAGRRGAHTTNHRPTETQPRKRGKAGGKAGGKHPASVQHGADALPAANARPSASASASASVSTPPNPPGGDGCAEAASEEPDPEAEVDDTIDEMVPVCRELGVRMHRFPLRRTLREFCHAGGSVEVLADLCALARTGEDPAARLMHWVGDPYVWRSVLDDQTAAQEHREAWQRARKAATDAEFRAANGLAAPTQKHVHSASELGRLRPLRNAGGDR